MLLLMQAIWGHIWKCTAEKDQTNATNVTILLLVQAIWGHIWKHTVEKSQANAISVTMHLLSQVIWGDIWKYTEEKSQTKVTHGKGDQREENIFCLLVFFNERQKKLCSCSVFLQFFLKVCLRTGTECIWLWMQSYDGWLGCIPPHCTLWTRGKQHYDICTSAQQCVQHTMHNAQCTMHNAMCTSGTPHCTLCTKGKQHSAPVHNEQCTIYKCTLHNAMCTRVAYWHI